jgi:TPR repeat protein
MSGRLKQARDRYDAGEFREARNLLRELATEGDSEAAGLLGFMCFLGQGGAVDGQAAKKWLTQATEAGIGTAAHNLGTLHQMGTPDVPRNKRLAAEYYDLARSLGCQCAPDEFYDSFDDRNEEE